MSLRPLRIGVAEVEKSGDEVLLKVRTVDGEVVPLQMSASLAQWVGTKCWEAGHSIQARKTRFDRVNIGIDDTPKFKMKDLVGKKVVLTAPSTTKGGTTFAPGEILEVSGSWRNRFHLFDPERPNRIIRHVSRNHVTPVEG